MATNELVIKITGDAKSFKGTLQEATAATEDFNVSLGAIAGIAAAAFAAATAVAIASVAAYKEAEEATNLLNNALQNQGLFSRELISSYREQATELQRLTGVDDDAIVKGQAQLQSMIGRVRITKEMTEAAVNLGAALGGDVSSGFELLGRAMEGNVRGLKQLGIEIDDNLTREERTAQILQKVSVAYGGLAQAQNQGLGSMKGFKSALDNLLENLGERFAPTVTKATELLTKFVNVLVDRTKVANTPLEKLDEQIQMTTERLTTFEDAAKRGVPWWMGKETKSELAIIKRELDELIAKREKMSARDFGASSGQDAAKARAAIENENLKRATQDRERAALLAHNQAVRLEVEGHTKRVLDLAREEAKTASQIADDKNRFIRGALQQHLDEVKALREAALQEEIDKETEFQDKYLTLKQEFGELEGAEKIRFEEESRLALESQMLTEQEARRVFYEQQIQQQIQADNQRLIQQQKFGKSWALINQTMNSEQIAGAKTLFGELAAMQQSGNSTLKSIGKAAALANIIIKTAEGATAAYAGAISFFGPIIGPPIGIAAAAALTAFGAEQTGKILAAKSGGLVTGGIPGVDSVPMLAQQGEIVAPAQSFEEVVGSVAARRMAEEQGLSGGGSMEIVLGFKDEAFELIERKLLERVRNGTSLIPGIA